MRRDLSQVKPATGLACRRDAIAKTVTRAEDPGAPSRMVKNEVGVAFLGKSDSEPN